MDEFLLVSAACIHKLVDIKYSALGAGGERVAEIAGQFDLAVEFAVALEGALQVLAREDAFAVRAYKDQRKGCISWGFSLQKYKKCKSLYLFYNVIYHLRE